MSILRLEIVVHLLNDQKRIRGARKMNLLLYWWNFDIMIHKTSVVNGQCYKETTLAGVRISRYSPIHF